MADLIQEQATTYTPGENDLVYNTVVTMGSYSSPQPVVIKQYDSLPIIAAKMRKDGNDYQVPDGAAVNIRLHKRSGTFIYSSVKGISQDRKIAYIQLTSNMTAVYGRTMPCLEIVVNGSVACTGDMVWDIQRNPVQEDDVKDTSEGQYIQEMAAQVQAFEDTYQEALDYMNNATNQSRINNAASNAQAAQQAATNAANSADEAEEEANRAATESAKALGFRSFHGGQVVPGATDGDLDPSRPMSTPTAASVTIKARGDRIAGLTMAGKTTQEGTGDPSPDNIRMIDGVGMYDKTLVLDGSEDEGWVPFQGVPDVFYIDLLPRYSFNEGDGDGVKVNRLRYRASAHAMREDDFSFQSDSISASVFRFIIKVNGAGTNVQTVRNALGKAPLTVWYRSVDFYKCKGPFYTVVELSQDPYRAVGFELTQPLFDGDSLEIGGLSGFDKMVVLDGSEDEGWYAQNASNGLYRTKNNIANDMQPSSQTGNTAKSNYLRSIGASWADIKSGEFFTEALSYYVGVCISSITTLEAFKSYLSAHPLTVFYKSVNYTPEADIAVALEKRVNGYAAFDGTETSMEDATGNIPIYSYNLDNASRVNFDDIISSHYIKKSDIDVTNNVDLGIRLAISYSGVLFRDSENYTTKTAFDSFISDQNDLGTPVQVVYELATPVSYARPVPTMIAQPGEDGTFTVTGENNLSVLLKAFQDGGNAARLEGHTWDDIMAAIDQKIASLVSTAMEVN